VGMALRTASLYYTDSTSESVVSLLLAVFSRWKSFYKYVTHGQGRIADIETFNDSEVQGALALNDSAAHDGRTNHSMVSEEAFEASKRAKSLAWTLR
jgi:hypothetical protein